VLQPKIWTTLRTYTLAQLKSDIFAGVTVAMVALPLSLAIAIASGAKPADGLVTAIVAGFLISFLGGSRVQIGGPTGAFIVVVYSVISNHGYDGLVLATFIAGILLVVAGYFRFGSLISYVPEPVINGFTIGIAILIATSQLKDLLGLTFIKLPADFLETWPAIWHARHTFGPDAFGTALGTIALILVLRRAAPKFPGLIFAVGLASLVALVADFRVDTIADRFGSLPSHLPMPTLPTVSFAKAVEVLPSAITIAFLAGIESLLSAMVADRMISAREVTSISPVKPQHRPNAEILAQGIANIGSSLFGGLPATGAIARTATNIRAGAQTPVAGIVHAVTVMVTMIFASRWAGQLAMPALAGLLILTAWNMSEPKKWLGYMRERASDRVLLLVTLALTVIADLTIAIGVGVALGLALRMRERGLSQPRWPTPDR
jgi:SulP family sulfate permease